VVVEKEIHIIQQAHQADLPQVVAVVVDPAAGLSLTLETTAPFDCVVVWSETPRPMVCLEPWTAPRQALVSGDRRLLLAPGENSNLHCRYRLETLTRIER
jgi:galactose mutarotase-like enzyme